MPDRNTKKEITLQIRRTYVIGNLFMIKELCFWGKIKARRKGGYPRRAGSVGHAESAQSDLCRHGGAQWRLTNHGHHVPALGALLHGSC